MSTSIVAGVVVVLLGFVAWMWTAGRDVISPKSDAVRTTTASTTPTSLDLKDQRLDRRSYDKGDCVTWEAGERFAPTAVVDCGEPHRVQMAGRIELKDDDDAPFPTDSQWDAIYKERCGPVVEKALGGPLDPAGRWAVGGITPSPESWAELDRDVWCGATLVGDGLGNDVALFEGKVDLAAQVTRTPAGQCLAFAPDRRDAPVDCNQPHQVEVAGQAELGTAGGFPGDDALITACESTAKQYMGPNALYSFGYRNFDEGSWHAGRRWTDCVVGVPGDLQGWGTTTGPLRR